MMTAFGKVRTLSELARDDTECRRWSWTLSIFRLLGRVGSTWVSYSTRSYDVVHGVINHVDKGTNEFGGEYDLLTNPALV